MDFSGKIFICVIITSILLFLLFTLVYIFTVDPNGNAYIVLPIAPPNDPPQKPEPEPDRPLTEDVVVEVVTMAPTDGKEDLMRTSSAAAI